MEGIEVFKRFSPFSSEKGTVLILFALLIPVLLLLIALSVDLSRQAYINTQLAYACDAAAIGAARYNTSDVQTNGLKFFYANYPQNVPNNLAVTPTITLSSDNQFVSVSAQTNMPTTFSFLNNILSLNVKCFSQVTRKASKVEVALVLDNTGSMAGSKFTGLKTASKTLINTLFGSNVTLANTAVSIVPFAAVINIGTSYTNWLSDPGTLSTFPSSAPWKGCVKAVDLYNVMDIDDPPSSSRKWPVYYTPSTLLPNIIGDNDWINLLGIVVTMNLVPNVDVGPNRNCGTPILPLTNNRDTLLNKIDNLSLIYGGGTFGNLGLVWGWNTISPKWSGIWTTASAQPGPYSPLNKKNLVIITDGENQWYDLPLFSPVGDPTAYGRLYEGKLGTTSLSTATPKINDRVADLCTKIKAQGIQLFTVTFQVADTGTNTLYKNCATKPEWALNAQDSNQLNTQFQYIAQEIQNQITIVK